MPLSASLSLRDLTTAQQHILVADCVAAQIVCERVVQRGTLKMQDKAWRRLKDHCSSIGIKDDLFLTNFTRDQQTRLIGAFAMAVQEARFSGPFTKRLAASTVKDTLQYQCAAFLKSGNSNPTFDKDHQLALLLQQQFRAFKNADPAENHQKAIPMSVISEINKRNSSALKRATAQLVTITIFFAMCSCEYLKVQKANQQRMEIIRLRHICFFEGTELLEHNN